MFRVQSRFEIPGEHLGPGEHDYHVVQQGVELPLWNASVLPRCAPDVDPGFRLWERYLATTTEMMLRILDDAQPQRARLHVLLPGYMTQDHSLTLTRCLSIWEGRAVNDVHHPQDVHHLVWMFETELGWFVDPLCGVQGPGAAIRHTVRWQDTEGEWDKKGRRKRGPSAPKKQ